MKVVTHNGLFHAHDIFAVALVKRVYGDVEIVRTRDQELIENQHRDGAWVVDVGNKMDEENNFIDHHLFRGEVPLEQMFFGETLEGLTKDQLTILHSVAKQDCGVEATDYVSTIIAGFNPVWDDEETSSDQAFLEAVDWAMQVLENPGILIKRKESLEKNRQAQERADEIVAQAVKNRTKNETKNNYLLLKRFVPWTDLIVDLNKVRRNKIMFVIFKGVEGDWRVQSVPLTKTTFDNWGEVVASPDDEGFIFRHPSGFIAGFECLKAAIKAVEASYQATKI